MADFINWCNNNVGIISIILSALTLFVSMIALVVSIRTARLPYKKKVRVSTGSYISAENIGCYVTATNVGNRKIKIQNIGLKCYGKVFINTKTIMESKAFLGTGDTTTQYFELDELKRQLIAAKAKQKQIIKAFVEDTEGSIYQKRLSSVKRLVSITE